MDYLNWVPSSVGGEKEDGLKISISRAVAMKAGQKEKKRGRPPGREQSALTSCVDWGDCASAAERRVRPGTKSRHDNAAKTRAKKVDKAAGWGFERRKGGEGEDYRKRGKARHRNQKKKLIARDDRVFRTKRRKRSTSRRRESGRQSTDFRV